MPRTAVVTDSTAYLPPELVAGNSIGIVSLYVNFGGDRAERETDLMKDLDAFYDEIRSAEQWPTTSQPSVGDFVEAYEPLLADGGDVVSIHISEGISGHVRLRPPGGRAAARRRARAASASAWSTRRARRAGWA